MIKKFIQADVKSVNQEEGTFEVVASSGNVDRLGDTIDPKGWYLKNYKKNPVILWSHSTGGLGSPAVPPVGKADKIWIENDKELKIKGHFADTPFAQELKTLVEGGFLNAVSVGFLPLLEEKKGDIEIEGKMYRRATDDEIQKGIYDSEFGEQFTKQELLEVSWVSVPALPQALVSARKMNLALVTKALEEEIKGTIPFKATPKAPEGESWSAGTEVKKATGDAKKLRTMHAWVDSGADNFDASERKWYKLPHHKGDGSQDVVWRGVAAAMGALLGARGGVDIPSGDRKGVYNHLVKHYKQFDKKPPEFREYSEEELESISEGIEEKENYDCECLDCGYKMTSEKHCADIKCPKCGGEMRRVERPGSGKGLTPEQFDKISNFISETEKAINALKEIINPDKSTAPSDDIKGRKTFIKPKSKKSETERMLIRFDKMLEIILRKLRQNK